MSATARARGEAKALDLTTLRRMSFKELDALYRAGKRPFGLSDLDGDAIGAMLAWRTPATGPLAWLLRSFGASTAFPWDGKTFQSQTSETGEGINRVFGDRKPSRWFRFATRIEPSRAGAFDAFQLDYDNPGNPFFIRAIKDEIRRVAPGLYLGQAYLLTKKRARLVLYFGLALP